jgi:hypothetical protein
MDEGGGAAGAVVVAGAPVVAGAAGAAVATGVAVPTDVAVFLVQAENDYDVSPSRAAGAELEKRDRDRNRVHVYPPYGATAQDGHGGFCTRGFDVWGVDVLESLGRATESR